MTCKGDCAKCELPAGPEWQADDVWIKQMLIANKHDVIPQHSHGYDHISLLAKGSVRLWKDGDLVADYTAPQGIFIKAGVMHTFQALEPGTIIYCIHNLHGQAMPSVVALNEFQGAA